MLEIKSIHSYQIPWAWTFNALESHIVQVVKSNFCQAPMAEIYSMHAQNKFPMKLIISQERIDAASLRGLGVWETISRSIALVQWLDVWWLVTCKHLNLIFGVVGINNLPDPIPSLTPAQDDSKHYRHNYHHSLSDSNNIVKTAVATVRNGFLQQHAAQWLWWIL